MEQDQTTGWPLPPLIVGGEILIGMNSGHERRRRFSKPSTKARTRPPPYDKRRIRDLIVSGYFFVIQQSKPSCFACVAPPSVAELLRWTGAAARRRHAKAGGFA